MSITETENIVKKCPFFCYLSRTCVLKIIILKSEENKGKTSMYTYFSKKVDKIVKKKNMLEKFLCDFHVPLI